MVSIVSLVKDTLFFYCHVAFNCLSTVYSIKNPDHHPEEEEDFVKLIVKVLVLFLLIKNLSDELLKLRPSVLVFSFMKVDFRMTWLNYLAKFAKCQHKLLVPVSCYHKTMFGTIF